MRKKHNWCKRILMSVWLAAFLLQLVLAVCWAVQNWNCVQEFYDTKIYIDGIINRTTDGWHLPGYSVLLFVIRKFFGFVKAEYIPGVYMFQVLFSLFCFTEGLRSLVKAWTGRHLSYLYAVLAGIYILTLPTIWQMQFALLPDAMCLAATCILAVKLLEMIRDPLKFRWDCLYVVAGALLLTGTYERHYFYGCLVLTICFGFAAVISKIKTFKGLKKEWKTAVFLPAVIVIVTFATMLYPRAIGIAGPYPSYSITADFMRRTVVPYVTETSKDANEEWSAYITPELVKAHEDSEIGFYTAILPSIEQRTAPAQDSVYADLILYSMKRNGADILSRFVKETAGYLVAPFSNVKYIYAAGNSHYGYNFSRMWLQAPKLTGMYMRVGTIGFALVVTTGIACAIFLSIKDKKYFKNLLRTLLLSLSAIVCITVPLALFATRMYDYRLSLFAQCVWVTPILFGMFQGFAKVEKK